MDFKERILTTLNHEEPDRVPVMGLIVDPATVNQVLGTRTADFIGLMCPGMPQTSNAICDKIGHIMNYGDGVYGGMFVCALYTEAFFEKDKIFLPELPFKRGCLAFLCLRSCLLCDLL